MLAPQIEDDVKVVFLPQQSEYVNRPFTPTKMDSPRINSHKTYLVDDHGHQSPWHEGRDILIIYIVKYIKYFGDVVVDFYPPPLQKNALKKCWKPQSKYPDPSLTFLVHFPSSINKEWLHLKIKIFKNPSTFIFLMYNFQALNLNLQF